MDGNPTGESRPAGKPTDGSPTDGSPTDGSPTDGNLAGGSQRGGDPAGGSQRGGDPAGESPADENPTGEEPAGDNPTGVTPTADSPADGNPTGEGQADDKPSAAGERPEGVPARKRRRRILRVTSVVLALLLLPLLTAETALRLNYTGDPAPGTRTRHQDALWLGHAWVDGRKTGKDVKALARRLSDTGIRDLYVHAGPLEHDGTLPASAYPKARWLTAAVHRELPGVRVQAWLGDKLASEGPEGLRLDRPATRAAVLDSTRSVLAAGFQGAHFDLEPLHSGDRDYLGLLDDLRELTHARGAVLSVAAHQIDPLPAFHSFWGATTGHPKWWSQAYFGQVARRVDQIAVMSYDTMQPLQSLYGGYVAQQTSLALEVTPEGTDLLMGLPFYHENRFGHWAHAETVPAAVRGVRLGLSRTDADRARFGVALYVDFAATEDDWTAYRKDWVRTP
ncbi:hypothetical protein [Streptomyces cinerochromogenes]|uniref:hypothetical protein n=1 Tax=Streptomyces cinerochromogenes TaxID=66422 RepID=UPI0019B8992B|nr:hypothetical protein [Streptomyces cinerochromogenes]GGS79294.1 membrane protein [Streptomyces cinerochromogenes]